MFAFPGPFPEMGMDSQQDVGKGQHTLEQGMDRQRCPLVDAEASTGVANVLRNSVRLDVQDLPDLRIRLVDSNPSNHLKLVVSEPWFARSRAQAGDHAHGLKGDCGEIIREHQSLLRKCLPRSYGKGH